MKIKRFLCRFRAWKKHPVSYSYQQPGEHRCLNCGHHYTGNYCPICGQQADVSRITWKSVGKGILQIWGVEDRSLPNTLLQLMLRPGYLIGDFLDGRRQVCHQPVKMLFVTASIYTIILHFLGIRYQTQLPEPTGTYALFWKMMEAHSRSYNFGLYDNNWNYWLFYQ